MIDCAYGPSLLWSNTPRLCLVPFSSYRSKRVFLKLLSIPLIENHTDQTSILEMAQLDELCASCSKVDFFSLFTGPRYFPREGYNQKPSISLGTLAEVRANANCPFCRLLCHDISESELSCDWLEEDNYVDPTKIRVNVHMFRADYDEEMKYTSSETLDMVATRLEIRLNPMEPLSDQEKGSILQHPRGAGIQLLSPDSVDPARPLLNGHEATTTSNSLELLAKWLKTCVQSHTLESNKENRSQPYFRPAASEYDIRVIDVNQRTVVEKNPEEIDYAALSYVWGKTLSQDLKNLDTETGAETDGSSSLLPATVPKVVEDALLVCKKLFIPYLWVDRYCIDQNDLIRKGSEIEGMGYRYLYATITLISGMEPEAGLLPGTGNMAGQQRIELIQGRKYITCLPSITDQLHASQWLHRAWTMQEGQLANRCAFFGRYDISFFCGSGHWRESLHSGPFGHEAEMPNVNTDCRGYYLLSRLNWLNKDSWNFADYDSLLMSYTPRQLSFESDRLNAITGCLNLIADVKGVPFVQGLPIMDFHYALLWTGEYDRRREGFPSWSWASWHCLQQSHLIYPQEGSCGLKEDEHGVLRTVDPGSREVELQGLLVTLTEAPHRTNKCSQRFAKTAFPSHKDSNLLTITSEIAHFSIDIHACPTPLPSRENHYPPPWLEIPHDFDSTARSNDHSWDHTAEYKTPFGRISLRDDYGNVNIPHYPRWYDHWPPFMIKIPSTLQGGTISWLLREGIDLIMIVELELLEGDESLRPFHQVLCLGIDRRVDGATRFGVFCLPKDIWDAAHPEVGTIILG